MADLLQALSGLDPNTVAKLIDTLAILLILGVLRLLAVYLVNRRTEDATLRYRWRKTSAYVAGALGILVIAPMWLAGVRSLATFLGLFSAGLAIALQDPVSNLAGWLFIIWRQPFKVGDRVQVGSHAGDVIDVRLFQFSLLEIGNWVAADQSTGRIVHVPNRKVFSDVVANYSQGFEYIWHEIPVLITFESNWEQAKVILQEIANRQAAPLSEAAAERIRQATRRYMIMYSKLTPIVYTRVEASGVLLTIRYLCEVRRRRSTEQEIWEAVLRAFAERPDIEFAYPTRRLYAPWLEGKGEG